MRKNKWVSFWIAAISGIVVVVVLTAFGLFSPGEGLKFLWAFAGGALVVTLNNREEEE